MKKFGTGILGIVLLTLATIVFAGIWAFLIHQSSAYKREITAISTEMFNQSKREESLLSLKLALREEEENLDEIQAQFLNKDDIPDFISTLEQMATSSRVKITLSSVDLPENATESVIPLKIHISGSGTWRDVIRFVSSLDSSLGAAKIENAHFSRPTADLGKIDGMPIWNFNADFTQFVSQTL